MQLHAAKNTVTSPHYARLFWMTLLLSIFTKLVLCELIPVTGDEAYYAIWGEFPALGYYDHTPFIGWLLYPFMLFGHHQLMLRLPTVLMTTFMGLMLYAFLKPHDERRATLAATLFLISPLSLCGVLITTDTPVILFSFLSGICVLQGIRKESHLGWYALSGFFLGLAFFSKYFAVLLALAYVYYFLRISQAPRRYLALTLILAGVLPFGLVHLYWNYTHAWANILFNVYNRNTTDHLSLGTVLTYLVTLFYVITPPLCFYLFGKYRPTLFSSQASQDIKALNCFIVLPLIFFFVLSTYKQIGLHWPLSFVAFIYIWAGFVLTESDLKKSLWFMMVFSGIHLTLIVTLALMPMRFYQNLPISDKLYTKVVYFFKHKSISDQLNIYSQNYTFTSLDYVQADMMFYDRGQYAPTFGVGSVHGRQDDLMTDFSQYAHKNFLLFYARKPRPEEYQSYFAATEVHQFEMDNAVFYYVLGQDFNYPAYRDTVLRTINNTYWQIPSYLPHKPSFFCERYFAAEGCH